MALVRTFVRVDPEGKIELPRNVRLALGLKQQDVVEIKVTGPTGVFKKSVFPLDHTASVEAAPRGRPEGRRTGYKDMVR